MLSSSSAGNILLKSIRSNALEKVACKLMGRYEDVQFSGLFGLAIIMTSANFH